MVREETPGKRQSFREDAVGAVRRGYVFFLSKLELEIPRTGERQR